MEDRTAAVILFFAAATAVIPVLRWRHATVRGPHLPTSAPLSQQTGEAHPLMHSERFLMATSALKARGGDSTIPLETRLQLYGLYKQAAYGTCTTLKPHALDVAGCMKWNAWNAVGTLLPADAESRYIALAESILGTPVGLHDGADTESRFVVTSRPVREAEPVPVTNTMDELFYAIGQKDATRCLLLIDALSRSGELALARVSSGWRL